MWAVDFSGMITAQVTVKPLGIHKTGFVSKGPRTGGVGIEHLSTGQERTECAEFCLGISSVWLVVYRWLGAVRTASTKKRSAQADRTGLCYVS